jgi:MFS family permease
MTQTFIAPTDASGAGLASRSEPRPRSWPLNASGITLAVVCATTTMLMLDIAVVNTALTNIAADLQIGLDGAQWIADAYTLALAALVLTAGSLADRFG